MSVLEENEQMDNTRYGKYFVSHPIEEGPFGPQFKIIGERDFQANFTINTLRIDKPVVMEKSAHTHDFDIYLIFMAFNPDDMGDMGTEIEMYFGQEEEKHIINSPTCVFVPKKCIHAPLIFKKVEKPLLLIHATLAPRYAPAP
jgi:hypothetical protein